MNAERKLKKNLDHIQRDIGSLIDQFSEDKGETEASVGLRHFGEQSMEQARKAVESFNGAVSSLGQSLESANVKIKEQIKSNPYSSMAAAVGAGALAGFFVEMAWKKRQS